MSFEEILRKRPDLREHIANPPPIRRVVKPQPVVAPIPVSDRLARAAKANPESVKVKVHATDADGIVVADPYQRGVVVEETPEMRAVKEGRRLREQQWKDGMAARPDGGIVQTIYDPFERDRR